MKKNKQTINTRDNIEIVRFIFKESLIMSNKYRLNKITNANKKGRLILIGLTFI